MKTIIAIDPGNAESAFVIKSYFGIESRAKYTNQMVLSIIATCSAPIVVCEMVACYGMPVGDEVFETVRWIGRFEQVAIANGKEFHTVYRKDVKIHLCNSMRAKDGNIRQALIDRFGAPGTKKNPGPTYGVSNDIWQALAVAVTWSDKNQIISAADRSAS